MYDLVIVWALTFSDGPYLIGHQANIQSTITIDRTIKSSKATCQSELKKAAQLNGKFYRVNSSGSLLTYSPRLFANAYCTPH